jgi:hypothetical protein
MPRGLALDRQAIVQTEKHQGFCTCRVCQVQRGVDQETP